MTTIERIIAAHTQDGHARAGDVVWMHVDVRTARDFGGPNVVEHLRKRFKGQVRDPKTIFFTFDTSAPAKDIGYARNQHKVRTFAREAGIRVFDVDRGIGTHVMMETGLARPGATLIGTDSHYNILGAVGALGMGMGDRDVAFAFRTGKVWVQVPRTVRIRLTGMPARGVEAKDIVLFLLKKLGTLTLLGKAVEIEGEWVRGLHLARRITMASMATELGAVAMFLESGRQAEEDYAVLTNRHLRVPPFEDYDELIEIDITGVGHQVAAPPSPANVHDLDELRGTPVDSVFIGSCTNGRYKDIRRVWEVVGNRRVAPGVMAKIVPATRLVYRRMLESGILADLFNAGFIVANPGCGGCAFGQIGMTGDKEVQLSTANRNFPGKQGAGDTYLAGAAVAAATAVLGHIAGPEDLEAK